MKHPKEDERGAVETTWITAKRFYAGSDLATGEEFQLNAGDSREVSEEKAEQLKETFPEDFLFGAEAEEAYKARQKEIEEAAEARAEERREAVDREAQEAARAGADPALVAKLNDLEAELAEKDRLLEEGGGDDLVVPPPLVWHLLEDEQKVEILERFDAESADVLAILRDAEWEVEGEESAPVESEEVRDAITVRLKELEETAEAEKDGGNGKKSGGRRGRKSRG